MAEGGGGRRWFCFEDLGLPGEGLCPAASSVMALQTRREPWATLPKLSQQRTYRVTHTLCPDSEGWWCQGEPGWCWRVPTLTPAQAGALS